MCASLEQNSMFFDSLVHLDWHFMEASEHAYRSGWEVVFNRTTRCFFQPKLEKIKKNLPRKNSLHFGKWNFLAHKIKKIHPEKKVPYISGNGTF